MIEPDSVPLDTACILLGNYSAPTVRRMLRDGVLDSYGRGRLLRITLESIAEYKAGRRPWHGGASVGVAPSSGNGMARLSHGRRAKNGVVDFPIDRQPKKR